MPELPDPSGADDGAVIMENFIAGLPKLELHLHIEGTLEPELMFALGQRIGKPQSGLSRNMRSEPAILLPGERRAEGRS